MNSKQGEEQGAVQRLEGKRGPGISRILSKTAARLFCIHDGIYRILH